MPLNSDNVDNSSNTGVLDEFGTSVSLCGDSLAVGAPWERSNATGINGDQGDNSVLGAGAAYLFNGLQVPVETQE